jgi:glycosyltransferase involved in cell wall biosynthesis
MATESSPFSPHALEGKPLALLEAMAAALPPITTRIGGTRENVRAGIERILITTGDIRVLADALLRFWCGPDLRHLLDGPAEKGAQDLGVTVAATMPLPRSC